MRLNIKDMAGEMGASHLHYEEFYTLVAIDNLSSGIESHREGTTLVGPHPHVGIGAIGWCHRSDYCTRRAATFHESTYSEALSD